MYFFFYIPQSIYRTIWVSTHHSVRSCYSGVDAVEPRTLSHRAAFTHKILDLGGRSYLTREIIASSYNHDGSVTLRSCVAVAKK